MNTFFAQAAATGPDFWRVMEHAGLLAAILAAVATAFVAWRKRDRVQVTNHPLDVRIGDDVKISPKGTRYSLALCEERHRSLDARHAILAAGLKDLDGFARVEIDRIHDKIDTVDRRHADKLQQALKDINDSIAALPDKIIHLLRSTGQLKDHHDH